jgi:hypothetical protein
MEQVDPLFTFDRNLIFYAMHYSNTSHSDRALPPFIAGPIVDYSGSSGYVYSVLVNTSAESANVEPFSLSLQVIGCTLNVSSTNGSVDASTNHLIGDSVGQPTTQDSTWAAWSAAYDGKDGYVLMITILLAIY